MEHQDENMSDNGEGSPIMNISVTLGVRLRFFSEKG